MRFSSGSRWRWDARTATPDPRPPRRLAPALRRHPADRWRRRSAWPARRARLRRSHAGTPVRARRLRPARRATAPGLRVRMPAPSPDRPRALPPTPRMLARRPPTWGAPPEPLRATAASDASTAPAAPSSHRSRSPTPARRRSELRAASLRRRGGRPRRAGGVAARPGATLDNPHETAMFTLERAGTRSAPARPGGTCT